MDFESVVEMQTQEIVSWHSVLIEPKGIDLNSSASRINYENFTLWHLEDMARDITVSDSVIASVKRQIDKNNQRRNDCIERFDEDVLIEIKKSGTTHKNGTWLHSETPGSMVDRLSINALKIFHMKEQLERKDATDAHKVQCAEKLARLEEQRIDLTGCFLRLRDGLKIGKIYFKVYRQMKMYNDPSLNPVLYGKAPQDLK